jgi:integrase/recombinase XerC
LSSFYRYALAYELIATNPIACTRPRKGPKNPAHALPADFIKEQFAAIDTSTLIGKRDLALLAVALTTGRRVSELAGLRLGHISRQGQQTHVVWVRCKGTSR